METRACGKVVVEEELNKVNKPTSDRISNLPDRVLHHTLSFLPIKSIAQTSLLSKRWNSIWGSIPTLDFSTVALPNLDPENQSKTLALIITSVLSRHRGNSNVKVFRVSSRLGFCHLASSCLYDCVRWLVKRRVEELVLEVGSSGRFDLPLCVFQCDSLRCLKLDANVSWCGSPSFWLGATNGLRSLHTLFVSHVDFLVSGLCEDLFSGSSFPCLESLTVESCNGMTHLKISCPNLKVVHVNSMNINSLDVSGMRLENLRVSFTFFRCYGESWVSVFAPNLQTFSWLANCLTEKCLIHGFPALIKSHISCRCPGDLSMVKIHSAMDLISASSQVQSLVISVDFLRVLSKIYFEGGLPYPFVQLQTLKIQTTSLNRHDIPGIACLFKSSPMVHTILIEILGDGARDDKWFDVSLDKAYCTEEQYWESQAQALIDFLYHLNVAMIHVKGSMIHKSVVTLVRFLLEHGRGLQEMVLTSQQLNSGNLSLWEDQIRLLEGFPRASADVKLSIA
ncbi:hypothetical protein M0R45_034699 [Rubus argutus]|uniref:F-box domain-containing protein n=1 Tax=Rubus argutus TaxID=59490 RepID=A0AAW1VUN9_RUBAR